MITFSEFKGTGEEVAEACTIPAFNMEELNLNHDSQYPSWNSNWTPPEYNSEGLSQLAQYKDGV